MVDQAKLSGPLSPVREHWMPTEQAIEQYLAYEEQYGRGHALLACHAAFPLIVTSELVNLIRLNFLANQAIDWLAETDFLLTFCRPIDTGLGLYQIDPGLRDVMLADLQESEYGLNRLYELADFLLAYGERFTERLRRPHIARVHQWIAWSYLYPQKAVDDMRDVMLAERTHVVGTSQSSVDQIHVATMIEVMRDTFEIGPPSQEKQYQELLETAQIVANFWYRSVISYAHDAKDDFSEVDSVANDNMLISYSASAYIKRMNAETSLAQGRGGRGIKGMATRDEDEVINLLFARNLDSILLFTNKGRVYCSKVYELPEGSRTARGAHIANFLSLQPDETVSTMVIVPDFEQAEYITLITRQARIKRMELSAFNNVRSSGLIAMNLDPEDSLDWARLTNGNEEFIIVTRNGKALRFHEDHVRAMGRTAAGVMAMRLLDGDEIVSMDVVKHDHDLFVIHERGWGKRVPLEEYNAKGRYTQGMWTTDHNRLAEIGAIVAARVVHPQDEVTIMTSQGIVLRIEVRGISQMGRATRGVRIVKMPEDDAVDAIAVNTYKTLTLKLYSGTQNDRSIQITAGATADIEEIENTKSMSLREERNSSFKGENNVSTFALTANEHIRLMGIVANLSDWAGGARERNIFVGLAGLHKFRDGLNLEGIPRSVAGGLIEKLEPHGFLEERPTHHALGALCEYIIEHIPEQSQRDKQFLAELIVKYDLIKDAAYIQQLRTRFNITMQSQPAQNEASVLPTQPAIPSARKSSGIPATLLADIRQALLACDEIYDLAQLRAILRTSPLRPFANGLKTANNANTQVDYLIGDFVERQLVTGENGLVLLLKVLGNRYDPADARHNQLLGLAEVLQDTKLMRLNVK